MILDYDKIISLVYNAGTFVLSRGKEFSKENKNDYDFVTEIDTKISKFLKDELGKLYPEVGFVTEEEQIHTYNDNIFILDPIDGTTNLIYDYKVSSISLAYIENGKVFFGIVFNPFSGEMFIGMKDKGSYLYDVTNGIDELLTQDILHCLTNRLRVSDRGLKESLVEFGAAASHKKMADDIFSRGSRVFKECLDLRRACSTAITLCYIAAGRLDGYFEKVIKPWDYAAGMLILSEAGGMSSDWEGRALPLDRNGTIICSNTVIHNELIKLM